MAEILPSRIREAGVAIGTATQWLFNFAFSQITPYAVTNLGWRAFLMFCIFNWALVVFAWFFIKETKGRALEEMEASKSFRYNVLLCHYPEVPYFDTVIEVAELTCYLYLVFHADTAIDIERVNQKAKERYIETTPEGK